ncbi:4-fold beta flower protein [Nocardioides luti]|uniref:4-fold beta flower protein n=1 Tax=Nocardioides luti TaxID=2761101 RepID=UPI003CCC9A83
MDPIFGSSGQVVAWSEGDEILSLDGQYLAFLHTGSIIAYNGDGHIGWFDEGVFWDSSFRAVGMLRDATARLPRPGLGGVPGRPGRAGRPGRPGVPGTPGRPGRSNAWSSSSWSSWQP